MVSNSSSSTNGQTVFALDSQADVMRLLASVRSSTISPADKNELRDLIFLYTNGGHDDSVRITLEQKIAALQLPIVELSSDKKSNNTKVDLPTIGTYRSAPSFAVPVADFKSPAPAPEVKPVVTPAPAPEVKPVVTPAPAPEVKIPEPKEEASSPEATASPTVDSSLERIREIKSLVNEKVGNPVNLVETNPAVGREYMSALLEAMKKLNSGSSAVAAMSRLETAYLAVDEVLKNPKSQAEVVDVVPPAQSAPNVHIANISEVATRARALSNEAESEFESPVLETTAPEEKSTPVTINRPSITTTPVYKDESKFQREEVRPNISYGTLDNTPSDSARVPVRRMDQESEPVHRPVPISSTARTAFATDGHEEVVRPVTIAGTAAIPPNTTPITPLSSLSNPLVKGPKSMEETSVKVAQSGDPLFSAEVDNGLQQLLEEWPIFQKSGLFGTGPKGREHPLFKKMSGLQIPLLLAGRFEGANQEIKQSITDYMNGWRYEQGLIYEQGETFEHYLRRVIRHILDLQKNKI